MLHTIVRKVLAYSKFVGVGNCQIEALKSPKAAEYESANTTYPIAAPLFPTTSLLPITASAAMSATSRRTINMHLTTQNGTRTRLRYRVLLSAPKGVSPEENGIVLVCGDDAK
jgi:hypothetical protein